MKYSASTVPAVSASSLSASPLPVEPLVPSSGTAAFSFADAPSPAACAPWASRAVRAFHARFLQDATSKEPIEI